MPPPATNGGRRNSLVAQAEINQAFAAKRLAAPSWAGCWNQLGDLLDQHGLQPVVATAKNFLALPDAEIRERLGRPRDSATPERTLRLLFSRFDDWRRPAGVPVAPVAVNGGGNDLRPGEVAYTRFVPGPPPAPWTDEDRAAFAAKAAQLQSRAATPGKAGG